MNRRSSLGFALAFGGYAGLLVGSLVVLRTRSFWDPVALGTSGVAFLLAATYALRRDDLPERLVRSRGHVAAACLPVVSVLPPVVDARETTTPFGIVAVAAFAAGVALAVRADNAVARRARERQAELADWAAVVPSRRRKRRRRVAAAAGGVTLLVANLRLSLPAWAASLAIGVGCSLVVSGVANRTRFYRFVALEEGVVLGANGAVREAYVPWDRFTGFEVGDDEVVLRRRGPFRSIRWDRDDVRNPDRVERTLSRNL